MKGSDNYFSELRVLRVFVVQISVTKQLHSLNFPPEVDKK